MNRFGIVHGADSFINHTNALGEHEITQGTKIFRVGMNAAVSFAGNWFIANDFMDSWMQEFISQQIGLNGFSLRSFARALQGAWHDNIPENRRMPQGNWAHICGVESSKGRSHAEFWAVSNIRDQNLSGPTRIDSTRFHHWEDFATRDCHLISQEMHVDLYRLFAEGSPASHVYMNGNGHGRLLSNVIFRLNELRPHLGPILREFLTRANSLTPVRLEIQEAQLESILNPMMAISAPASLQETEELVRSSVRLISAAFELSHDSAIGGEIQTASIAFPDDLIETCRLSPLYLPRVIENDLPPEFESNA